MHLDLSMLVQCTCGHQLGPEEPCPLCNFLAIQPWLLKQYHSSYNPQMPHKLFLKGYVFSSGEVPVTNLFLDLIQLSWNILDGPTRCCHFNEATLHCISYASHGKDCLATAVAEMGIHPPESWPTFHRCFQSELPAVLVPGSIGGRSGCWALSLSKI